MPTIKNGFNGIIVFTLTMNESFSRCLLLIILLLWSSNLFGQQNTIPIDTIRNIHLEEVIINATQPDIPGTRSIIGQDAIKHIQATDLSGLTQLLPGVGVRNPNLNLPALFTIRSTSYENTTNALGTAILIDGARMSNNANMQQTGLGRNGNPYNSTALSGRDVRSIAPASVESIEVIRGIPSARYGDVTSGVVLVKSKAGLSPLSVGLRFTATEKLASIGKGFNIGENNGTLYLGTDYAYSAQSPLVTEEAFQRVGVQAAYAKDFPSATLRLNLRGYLTSDNDKRGNNTVEGEFRKYLNQGFSLSANGQWNPEKTWLTYLEYQAGLTFEQEKNETRNYYSGTQQVTTYTTQAGEQEGIFLLPNYFSKLGIEGKPIQVNASWTAGLKKMIHEKIFNHFQIGIHAEMEGNRGNGIQFDPLYPPAEMLQVRTRSYREIPFLYQYGGFAENLISFHSGQLRTELQAGVRISQPITQSIHYRPAADPRINLRQVLIENSNSSILNRLSIRAGWGLLHKLPVLAYLYPDKSYTDKNCFTYNDAENNHRLTVMHTFVTDDTFNSGLRLPVNRKIELGINFRFKEVEADIVWFNEHLKNGYCTTDRAAPFSYHRYDPLTNKGETPTLTDKGIINNGSPLPYTTNTTFAVYTRPENGIEQKKQGVEYTVGPIRWKQIRSSLFINGSYIKVKEKNTALSAIHPSREINGQPYPYTGIYEATTSASNLRIHQLFSTRFQFITQIPGIGLVTSLALQCIWLDKQQRGMESSYNTPIYLTDSNGNRIEGNPMNDTEYQKCLNPVYYIDGKGNRFPFTQEMETDRRFSDLVLKTNTRTAFLPDSSGPYFLLNLRITKDIGRHISVAFCANNLTKSNPKRYSSSTQQYTILNPELYYGAEINFRF